jgi:TonB family protein
MVIVSIAMWNTPRYQRSRFSTKFVCQLVVLAFPAFCVAQSAVPVPSPPPSVFAEHRLRVSEASTSPLLIQKVAPKYPDVAAKTGIQGTVVLVIVIDTGGTVKEVSVVSGDPTLAQAASDAVRHWRYKPYTLDGSPIEIETQVSLNFHLEKTPPAGPPPPGVFHNNTYTNDAFMLSYPLPSDWVRSTELIQKRMASKGQP